MQRPMGDANGLRAAPALARAALPKPIYDGDQWNIYVGDSRELLRELPSQTLDCTLTSPPYWNHREYGHRNQIGQEEKVEDFVADLRALGSELLRVTRASGSLWLNIGDTYRGKDLVGIPWQVAFALKREGWILRNAVIWHKTKHVPSNSYDRLANAYEFLFHFTKTKAPYYNMDAIRNPPKPPTVKPDGTVVSPTGVSGRRYRKQIMASPALTPDQRARALRAVDNAIERMKRGELPDFRMLIKGVQRVVHSDDPEMSGRAGEVEREGFAILPYHPNGSVPTDVWSIQPEDEVFPDSTSRYTRPSYA